MKKILANIRQRLVKVPKMWYLVIGLAVILAAALVLCFVLIGRETPEPAPTAAPTTVITEPATVPTTVETEPKQLRHPLNGTPLEEPYMERPIAVVTPNDSYALPQHGIGNADVVYEIEAEGGITRCLAIYSDVSFDGKIGPIRSARTYFNSVAKSYDAPIVHCGGSPGGRKGHYSDSGKKIKDWAHIDEMQNYGYFYRDSDRLNSGYAYEYTLYTNGQKLLSCMEERAYNTREERDYKLNFDEAPSVEKGETATQVTVGFRGNKKTVMTLNEETGLYEAYQHGKNWIDGNTGNVLSFRNLVMLQAEQWHDSSGYRTYYDLYGSGKGYFACDGKIVPIKWVREKLSHSFQYFLEDGTPVNLGVGKTYISIASLESTTAYN